MGSSVFDFAEVRTLYLLLRTSKTIHRWIYRSFKTPRRVTSGRLPVFLRRKLRLCRRVIAFSQMQNFNLFAFDGMTMLPKNILITQSELYQGFPVDAIN
jgi:hypothetical protein